MNVRIEPSIVLDLPVSHWLPGAGFMSAAQLDALTGGNSGNFAFRYALTQVFFPNTPWGTFSSLHDLPADSGPVLLACANWIGKSPAHEQVNETRLGSLERAKTSIVPFGLGCQLPLGTLFDDLGPFTKKFLLKLCDTSPSISVRDEQTAAILASIGCKSVSVTGCPSNFINPDPTLGKKIAEKAQALFSRSSGWRSLAVSLTEYSGGYGVSSPIFEQHFSLMRDHAASYVVQDFPLLPVLLRQQEELPPEYHPKSFPNLGCGVDLARVILRRASVYFASYDQWLLHSRRFDLSMGMRLHGNITCTQAEVPSLVITHDARTAESCRTTGMPAIDAKEYLTLDLRTPDAVLQRIHEGAARYDRTRGLLALKMIEHLDRAQLPLPEGLRTIAASLPADTT